jgi:ubiquinone/menaquinone biosynthesis C-methylase UbiE
MAAKDHWQSVYATKRPDEVSWYRPHLDISLAFVRSAGLSPDARIADIGGGASTLVDDLVAQGFRNVAVVDIAATALEVARNRLGDRADDVQWIEGDVTRSLFAPSSIDFWHDRAVFHFLVDPEARAAYLEQVTRAVRPGGRVLVATFGLDGPEHCSGLPTMRYDPAGIKATFGDQFEKLDQAAELHQTPWGKEQSFVYCFCKRRSAAPTTPPG